MASEKKASEGIALLSMYGDEDDEMEDLDDDDEDNQAQDEDVPITPPGSDAVAVKDGDDAIDSGNEIGSRQMDDRGLADSSTPSKTINHATSSASGTPLLQIFSPQQPQQPAASDLGVVQSQKSRLTIVDYGHEEGAMSPEPEDGQLMAAGRVVYGELLQTNDGESEKKSPGLTTLSTPSAQVSQSLEQNGQPESNTVNHFEKDSEYVEMAEDAVMLTVDEQKDIDPLDKFLPPPPKAKCSEELQERIIKFLSLKNAGKSYNVAVRNKKEYRNPDFLLHAVTYQDIDQIGSCFSKDVFDPHGYDKSDFYDEIEADMRRELERREQERKKNQKLDFTPGGIQQGNVVPAPKINIPTPGSATVSSGVAGASDTAREGRQNKKSKWDKVDDQINPLVSGGQEGFSAIGAHAAILSAAKAGSGYSGFAQQRRKEAEDRRSSDRKLERRS